MNGADFKKILIIGQSGFLGSELIRIFINRGISFDSLDRKQFDLRSSNFDFLENKLKMNRYGYVLICAAISDVEKCFLEQETSQQVNVTGTIELLKLLQKYEATPIFFSTDYVLSGGVHPYLEQDSRNPKTEYGKQKAETEKYIEEHFKKYLIFRTSKLMSKTKHPRNILAPILEGLISRSPIRCFEDQFLNPVFVEDIAEVILKSIQQNISGIFHLGTRKIFTRYELACFLAKQMELNSELLIPIQMREIRFSESRPTHNILNCEKIERALSFRFCEAEDALSDLRRNFCDI